MAGRFNKRNYEKGRRAEYKVIRTAEKKGYLCMRAPASGRALKRHDMPDVVCVNPRACDVLAIEVKYSSKEVVRYISKEQYETLSAWREKGARAFVVVVFEGGYMVAVPLEKLIPHHDPEWPYKVTVDLMRSSKRFEDVLAEGLHRTLDQFAPKANIPSKDDQ